MATEEELLAEMHSISVELVQLRAEYIREGKKRDERIRRNKWWTWIAVTVGIVGIFVGGFGVKSIREAAETRKSRSLGVCLQYNVAQRDEIRAQSAQAALTINQIATTGGTEKIPPELQPTVDRVIEEQQALIREGHKLRDCSEEGIETYLEGITGEVVGNINIK